MMTHPVYTLGFCSHSCENGTEARASDSCWFPGVGVRVHGGGSQQPRHILILLPIRVVMSNQPSEWDGPSVLLPRLISHVILGFTSLGSVSLPEKWGTNIHLLGLL